MGSLALVCGPWSSLPYTMNWRHLGTLGMTNTSLYDSWVGGNVHFKRLHDFLVDSFEREGNTTNSEVLLRPPSLKMCPPNYMLRSIMTWEKGDDTDSREIVGLHALNCIRSERNQEAGYSWGGDFAELTVHLTPQTSSLVERANYIYPWYEAGTNPKVSPPPFTDRDLDLRQRIGNPGDPQMANDGVPSGTELREVGCHRLSGGEADNDDEITTDYVITGFVAKAANGRIKDIVPLCVRRP